MMTIMLRMTRLLRADINALLDRFEAPDLILSQVLSDMEQALDRDRQEMARLERGRGRLAERLVELERLVQDEAAALEDCLDAGQEDLARSVIRRRLENARRLDAARRDAARLDAGRSELERRIGGRSERLEALRAQAELHEAVQSRDPEDPAETDPDTACAVRDAEIEVALLRAKRARGARS
ncbi:PspA/IM30 family protein [Imhoffiella purpurea]|uniref:Phage shock protein A n=1 Tax=Imhoffiella purpurea TaxID=1249627 RepID=W9VV08_9GAMM|nr:PspA/IM30 family protein [Imhoffiella purpurea]EXJ14230.1 phage shock protein A [Imhoffiella purpurea]